MLWGYAWHTIASPEAKPMQAARALILGIATARVLASPAAIAAEKYPIRPIHFISGFQAGGGVDTTARVIADWLSSDLGQQVVVEDRTGSGGNIAAQWVVNAPPDGYTILSVAPSTPGNMIAELSRSEDDRLAGWQS